MSFFFRFNCKDARRKRKIAPLKCLELVQNQLCEGPSTLQKPQPIQVSLPCSGWVLSRAIFCGPDRALDQPFFVQLFVLRIVLQMGLFACSFLWSRSCSRWVFSRATFCGPDRAPNVSFRVQLFVLQIVLQMGVFACNFLCSKSCTRYVFSRAIFCAPNRAPNRAPDGSFRVQLFVVQIVLQNGFFACNSLWSRRLKKSRGDKMHVAPALSLLAKVVVSLWGLRHLAAS